MGLGWVQDDPVRERYPAYVLGATPLYTEFRRWSDLAIGETFSLVGVVRFRRGTGDAATVRSLEITLNGGRISSGAFVYSESVDANGATPAIQVDWSADVDDLVLSFRDMAGSTSDTLFTYDLERLQT